jgi:hypothetical protein
MHRGAMHWGIMHWSARVMGNLAERLTGKEGRKGTEWTPDPGKEKPRRANHTGAKGESGRLSTVAR